MGKDPITGEPVPQDAESAARRLHEVHRRGRDLGERCRRPRRSRAPSPGSRARWRRCTGFVDEIPGLFVAGVQVARDRRHHPDSARLREARAACSAASSVRFITLGRATRSGSCSRSSSTSSARARSTYIKKTGAALKSILKNPLPFVGNLVKAAKLGFHELRRQLPRRTSRPASSTG